MSKAEFKSEGLDALRLYLLAQPGGAPVRQADLARHFGVNRSTIGRWLESLETNQVPVLWDEQKRVAIDRKRYFTHLSLSRYESIVLMLALRLYQQRQNQGDRNAVEMLQKLGVALHQGVAPGAGEHILAVAHQQRLQVGDQPSEQQRVLEALGEAWLDARKVQMRYRPLRARRAFDDVFHPYLLEPSAISRSTYVIGYSELAQALRVRKLERIERTPVVLSETFQVIPGFEPFKLLGGAWGIWFDADSIPVTVQLRFQGEDAVRRMLEERWHPSERKERDAEGRLIWTAQIDEPLEMLHWIRGWGPACEVLAPPELRAKVMEELRRQSRLYGVADAPRAGAELFAHTPAPGSDEWHPLIDHLVGVAELARGFAEPFGAGELAYQLGLWHDVGKANPAFQAYLRRCHNDPKQKGTGPDHKAAGAVLAQQHMPPLMLLIQGHHGGLRDRNALQNWLAERQADVEPGSSTPAIQAAIQRVRGLIPDLDPAKPLVPPAHLRDALAAEFYLRMLFSTLVDADFLDTEQHRSPQRASARTSDSDIAGLWAAFERDQQRLSGQRDDLVGQARHTLYQQCLGAATQPPGLFRLAIPTGGGKTRSVMGFALRHALHHGMRRVIVAVPFISITEQTAAVYRSIFETESSGPVVLEHHSSVEGRAESAEFDPRERWQRLAAENWDAPIVVTTTVQLFESLFANQTGRCRKLHRLAGSVIILDEVQALPPHLLRPILDGLRELCAHYGATVVLSTATQPAFEGISELADLPALPIISDAERWFTALKRVHYEWRADQPLGWEEVAGLLRSDPQSLAVVNTKGDALNLLDALADSEALHLSTLLCGAHRRDVIAQVKQRLAAGQPCRLVSTQVIEAGVDLDFPLVLRALGPLDRIVQAAGRCNREGRLDHGRVVVFDPAEGKLPPGAYRVASDITRALIGSGALDPDSPADVRRYFEQLYATVSLDRGQIQQLRRSLNYPEIARAFRMIDEETEDVVISSYGDETAREQILDDLERLQRQEGSARVILRRLQPYLVSLRVAVAQRYRAQGLIEEIMPGLGRWHGRYDSILGLVADDDRAQLIF